MNKGQAVEPTQEATQPVGPYMVYFAGELFTQHDLATNVLIKEAVWRLSDGKFQLFLPQSIERRQLDRPDIVAFIRNGDLLAVVKADIILARFDGLELDSGTVVEFVMAKSLGKPSVILRCDIRRPSAAGYTEPYNLMVRSWPRNVDVHINSFLNYAGLFEQERQVLGDSDTSQAMLKAELGAVRKSVDELAVKIIDGLEEVIKKKSPYPPEYQEIVYKASRYSPGSGFDQLLSEDELGEIIQRLRKNGTF